MNNNNLMQKQEESKPDDKKEYEDPENKIDEIIEKINLNHPRNPYTHFVLEETEKYKKNNENCKINITEFNLECFQKWKKMNDAEKKKYIDIFEEEKLKFKYDLTFVRHHLFLDFNDNVLRPGTAYRIFLNEKLLEGFNKHLNPNKVKIDAKNIWAKMKKEEKEKYTELKKKNDNIFLEAEKINKLNAVALFIKKRINEEKDKYNEPPSVQELSKEWKNLSRNEKNNYKKYAREINTEKKKLRNIYDIIHGIRPKKPKGAFLIFLKEKAKKNEIKSLKDGYEIWRKLSEDEKEEYLKKNHRLLLAYKYKKMIHQKKIKKILPKRPKGPFQHFLKEKKGLKIESQQNWVSYWKSVYDGLTDKDKAKYNKKYEEEKQEYKEKMKIFNNKVFDLPKRPFSCFHYYISEKIFVLKKNNPNMKQTELIQKASEEWNSMKLEDRQDYKEKAKEDLKRFKRQKKQFEKLGYYSKDFDLEKGENDGEEKKSKLKKRRKSNKNDPKKVIPKK